MVTGLRRTTVGLALAAAGLGTGGGTARADLIPNGAFESRLNPDPPAAGPRQVADPGPIDLTEPAAADGFGNSGRFLAAARSAPPVVTTGGNRVAPTNTGSGAGSGNGFPASRPGQGGGQGGRGMPAGLGSLGGSGGSVLSGRPHGPTSHLVAAHTTTPTKPTTASGTTLTATAATQPTKATASGTAPAAGATDPAAADGQTHVLSRDPVWVPHGTAEAVTPAAVTAGADPLAAADCAGYSFSPGDVMAADPLTQAVAALSRVAGVRAVPLALPPEPVPAPPAAVLGLVAVAALAVRRRAAAAGR